ncbi:MAG TPA: TetR family transcriptional regulator [Thermoanaerobaculia bacterium]|jgi:TetR/AcrR family transcriptional regulator|nr:TetR family transcriptional regulator [Thermoanaerobaculia bacterium]
MRAARRRDPEGTRLTILDAAEAIFVEKGFAAASMSDIAARAMVTKSLIHHHFGSKEELWLEVKRRSLDEYVKAQRAIMASAAADQESFTESLRVYFRFLERNPNYVRLSTWMNLEDPKLSAPANPDLLHRGVERLRKAQAQGVFRRDVDPWHIMFAFFAVSTYWFQARHAHGHDVYADRDAGAADEKFLDDMLKILLEGVTPRAPLSQPRSPP